MLELCEICLKHNLFCQRESCKRVHIIIAKNNEMCQREIERKREKEREREYCKRAVLVVQESVESLLQES
jgi:hypothetical protein